MEEAVFRAGLPVGSTEWWRAQNLVNPEEAAMFLEHSLLEFLRQFFYVYFKSVESAHTPEDDQRYQMLKEWYMAVLPYYNNTSWSESGVLQFLQNTIIGETHEDVLNTEEADTDSEFRVASEIGDVFQTSQKTRPKLMRDLWRYNHNQEVNGSPPELYRHKARVRATQLMVRNSLCSAL